MDDLRQRLMEARRPELLSVLAAVIHSLTIRARYFYDEPDAFERLRETNEAIHRAAGHLCTLIKVDEPFTDSRLQGVIDAFSLLPSDEINRLLGS